MDFRKENKENGDRQQSLEVLDTVTAVLYTNPKRVKVFALVTNAPF
jgi:hypothetical protein